MIRLNRAEVMKQSRIAPGFFDFLAGKFDPKKPGIRVRSYKAGAELARAKIFMWSRSQYARGRSYSQALKDAVELELKIEKILRRAGNGEVFRSSPCIQCPALALCAANKTACNVFLSFCGLWRGGTHGEYPHRTIPCRETFESLSIGNNRWTTYQLAKDAA